jgi:hypothetical protein
MFGFSASRKVNRSTKARPSVEELDLRVVPAGGMGGIRGTLAAVAAEKGQHALGQFKGPGKAVGDKAFLNRYRGAFQGSTKRFAQFPGPGKVVGDKAFLNGFPGTSQHSSTGPTGKLGQFKGPGTVVGGQAFLNRRPF